MIEKWHIDYLKDSIEYRLKCQREEYEEKLKQQIEKHKKELKRAHDWGYYEGAVKRKSNCSNKTIEESFTLFNAKLHDENIMYESITILK